MNPRTLAAAAALATLAITTPAHATRHAPEGLGFCDAKYCGIAFGPFSRPAVSRGFAPHRVAWKSKARRIAKGALKAHRSHTHTTRDAKTSPTPPLPRAAPRSRGGEHPGIATRIVPNPEGCPRVSFCGCGTALHIFGKNVRAAWLAAWWFRFPSATPGPGKVAVRRHHVFAILRDLGRGRVLAYDPNSGGHKTRIHVRSLRGYSVRDPGGKRIAGL